MAPEPGATRCPSPPFALASSRQTGKRPSRYVSSNCRLSPSPASSREQLQQLRRGSSRPASSARGGRRAPALPARRCRGRAPFRAPPCARSSACPASFCAAALDRPIAVPGKRRRKQHAADPGAAGDQKHDAEQPERGRTGQAQRSCKRGGIDAQERSATAPVSASSTANTPRTALMPRRAASACARSSAGPRAGRAPRAP